MSFCALIFTKPTETLATAIARQTSGPWQPHIELQDTTSHTFEAAWARSIP
jgi:hypothetical protein